MAENRTQEFFLNGCSNAIDIMQKARIDVVLIAHVLIDVRAAALAEADLHRARLALANPMASIKPSELMNDLEKMAR